MKTYQVWAGTKVWRKGLTVRDDRKMYTFVGQELGTLEMGEENGVAYTVYKTENGKIVIQVFAWSAIQETQWAGVYKYNSLNEAKNEFGEVLKNIL